MGMGSFRGIGRPWQWKARPGRTGLVGAGILGTGQILRRGVRPPRLKEDIASEIPRLPPGPNGNVPGLEPGDLDRHSLGMQHSPGFLSLVNDAKGRIQEVSIEDLRARMAANPALVLLDVREESEWAAGHAVQAAHLGKGILERDLEARYPDRNAEVVMYCGGGFRSALTCDAAQKMGYTNVRSLIGGYKALAAAGWPMAK